MARGQWYELRHFLDLVEVVCGHDPEALTVRLQQRKLIYANAVSGSLRVRLVKNTDDDDEPQYEEMYDAILDFDKPHILIAARPLVAALRQALRLAKPVTSVSVSSETNGQAVLTVAGEQRVERETLHTVWCEPAGVTVVIPPTVAEVLAGYRWWPKEDAAAVDFIPHDGGYGLLIHRGQFDLDVAGVFNQQVALPQVVNADASV